MGKTKQCESEVGRAVASYKRALDRLVRLLKHKDETVRGEAGAALCDLNPPPVQAVLDAILESKDTGSQVRCIALLESMAPAAWTQVAVALAAIFISPADAEVRQALAGAAMSLRRMRVEAQSQPPAEF